MLHANQNELMSSVGWESSRRNIFLLSRECKSMKVLTLGFRRLEKIFKIMVYTDAYKVLFGTHMLSEEAEYWLENTRQRLEAANAEIT